MKYMLLQYLYVQRWVWYFRLPQNNNKIMSSHKKELVHSRIKSYHFDKLRQPIRVELEKKYTNPQTLNYNKYKYIQPQSGHSKLQQYIRSPLQKDQFLHRTMPSKTSPSLLEGSSEDRLSNGRSSPEHLSRSYSSFKVRENFTYLEQVIIDLADKTDLSSTRKYVNRIEGELAGKCQKIISKMENGYLSSSKQTEKGQQNLTKIYRLLYPKEPSTILLPIQKQLTAIETAITSLTHPRPPPPSQPSPKQRQQELSSTNSKLEKQSKLLYSQFNDQSSKMKHHYEEIYRKIYEESMKGKREMELAQKELEESKKEQGKFQNKYESVFKDISVQLCELKERCQLLKDENVKEKKRNHVFQGLVKERDEELGQVRREYAQLGEEVDIAKQESSKSGSKTKRCQLQVNFLSRQVETLTSEIDMQKTLNSLLQDKLQQQTRKNSNTLLFQLSDKSLSIPNQEESKHKEQQAASLQQLQTTKTHLNLLMTKQQSLQTQLSQESGHLESLTERVEFTIVQLERVRHSLAEAEAQLAEVSQRKEGKATEFQDLQLKLRTVEDTLDSEKEQLQQLGNRRQQTERDIGQLLLVLVRLESDQCISQNQLGNVEWVQEWLQWMQDTHRLTLTP